ncbi:MAG: hypothetical protein XD51_0488, partial [Moorella sp. 60_41]
PSKFDLLSQLLASGIHALGSASAFGLVKFAYRSGLVARFQAKAWPHRRKLGMPQRTSRTGAPGFCDRPWGHGSHRELASCSIPGTPTGPPRFLSPAKALGAPGPQARICRRSLMAPGGGGQGVIPRGRPSLPLRYPIAPRRYPLGRSARFLERSPGGPPAGRNGRSAPPGGWWSRGG